MALSREDYKMALDSQCAVNSSGLIHSLSKVVTKIWEEPEASMRGTEYVNKHPIVILYLTQLCHLAGNAWLLDNIDFYSQAYKTCKEMAGEEV